MKLSRGQKLIITYTLVLSLILSNVLNLAGGWLGINETILEYVRIISNITVMSSGCIAVLLLISELNRELIEGSIKETVQYLNCKENKLNTVSYYNEHSEDYFKQTVKIDMSEARDKLTSRLKLNARILDIGCGSGRDTFEFLKKNFTVDAIEPSIKMARLAYDYTGIDIVNKGINEFKCKKNTYDGVWACASLLHLDTEELIRALIKIHDITKKNGYIYMSFKYGIDEKIRDNKFYNDMTLEKLQRRLKLSNAEFMKIEEHWFSEDARGTKWLNVICKNL